MVTQSKKPLENHRFSPGILLATGIVALGTFSASSGLQTWLASESLSANFVSPVFWKYLNGLPQDTTGIPDVSSLSYLSVFWVASCIAVSTWISGALIISCYRRSSLQQAFVQWGLWGWLWWCALDLWEWIWVLSGVAEFDSLSSFLASSPQFWAAACLSGWISTWFCLIGSVDSSKNATVDRSSMVMSEHAAVKAPKRFWSAEKCLAFACLIYIVIFTTMNWRLYFNLLIPHGDSAMYEEHLWNILHGKGFRSYLDQGLFFGEHIQFVHLFLLPLYVLWPSHLLLELCESTALAFGAWPVFSMTRRQLLKASVAGSDRIALASAIAYLLYAPMQFLDIEIDIKTFRPEAFGIPLLLLTLDQLERRNFAGTLFGLAMTLTVKEDYAIVFGPLGLWIAWREFSQADDVTPKVELHPPVETSGGLANLGRLRSRWRFGIVFGMALSVFSVGYLWLATRVVMPWFRSGVEVHYARYFARFGETPEAIVRTMVTRPDMLFNELVTTSTVLYAVMMLAPLAWIPVFAPSRLAVGLPLFGILCLNELAKDPRHQFHAPLVAIVFWALASGIPHAIWFVHRLVARFSSSGITNGRTAATLIRHGIWTSALASGLFLSISPLGLPFWDFGSAWNWKALYGPSRRGELFSRVMKVIPQEARVASTDFVHPRFTHHERSYDYSGYARKVAGGRTGVPDDTDFLVIDTNHRYSEIKSPSEIPELRDHPEQWEIVPVDTDGYFIVMKRRR